MTTQEKHRISDEEVIRSILDKKDPEYFEILYDRYVHRVFNKSFGFVKDMSKAQDITHDIFLKVFFQLGTFKFKAKFSTWLYAVTYNYCVDYLNKEKSTRAELETYFHEKSDENVDSQEIEMMNIRLDHLKVIMDMLLPEERIILLLKYQDELSIKEIEAATELSKSAIKMRLKRSRDKVLQLYRDIYS